MGLIAVSRTGVAIFNPLTSSYKNAVEGSDAETFDNCDGHADPNGRYHYHKYPSCLANGSVDEFIGVAMDGYPIYGPNATWKSAGKVVTADLDRCHGKVVNGAYRYYVTEDWPYFLACFRGKVMDSSIRTSYNCESTSGRCSDILFSFHAEFVSSKIHLGSDVLSLSLWEKRLLFSSKVDHRMDDNLLANPLSNLYAG